MKKVSIGIFLLIFISSSLFLYRWLNKVEIDASRYKSFLQYPLSAGLPPSIEKISHNGNNIFLIVRKPSKEVDYSTPESLRKSVYKSSFKGVDVGHIQIAWSCNINGKQYKSATGFNGEVNNQVEDMVSRGFGATAFISTFSDGYFEKPADVEYTIKKYKKSVNIVKFSITEDECFLVLNKFWNLINKNESHRFSFSHSENSMSCSSFAFELLTPIDRLRKQYRSYGYRNMYLPKKLFGFPSDTALPIDTEIPEAEVDKGKRVRLLASLPKEWSKEGVYLQMFDIGALYNIPNH